MAVTAKSAHLLASDYAQSNNF